MAREVVRGAPLDAVDVGPFGNTAEGSADAVLGAVDALLRRALAVGATRISLQVTAIGEEAGRAGSGEDAGESAGEEGRA